MPPCIAHILYRTPTRIAPSRFCILSKLSGRNYAASVEPERPYKDFLTTLYRANAALPNILPSLEASSWRKTISTSGDIVSGTLKRKPRIAVWSSNELSQQTDLVSALLDDPLASDKSFVDALRGRRSKRNSDDVLTIKYGEYHDSITSLSLSLPWLRNLDVDIVEIPATHPDYKPLLYDADIQIIVISPLCLPLLRGLESLLQKPNSILVFNYPSLDQKVVDFALSRMAMSSPTMGDILKAKIVRVYPSKALAALDTFRETPNTAAAVQVFQTDFLDSGMPALSRSISRLLTSNEKDLKLLHLQVVLSGALEACHNFIEDTSRDTAVAQSHVQEIRARIEEMHFLSVTDVLGGEETGEIAEALRRSTQEMQQIMGTLSWWNFPFKVDELADLLSRAAERAWCRDLEAKLQFQTGRLSVMRSTLITETNTIIHLLPPSFRSAVLLNSLRQISNRPPELSYTSLTYPLAYRLRQLQYPIINLHRRAQRIVLAAVTTAFMSAGVAYTVWFLGWIMPTTAVGLYALGVMMTIRWLIGSWDKGIKRWWQDWDRVGEGMERDLKAMLTVVMQEKVTAVPITAAEELSKVVAMRMNDTKKMNDELQSLEESSRNLYSQKCASTE